MRLEMTKKKRKCSIGTSQQKLFYLSMSGKNFLKRIIIRVIIFGLYHEEKLSCKTI